MSDDYAGNVTLSDDQMTSLSVVVSACRSVGASRLPFAISDEELKDAAIAVSRLYEGLTR